MVGDSEALIDMVLVLGVTGAGKSYFVNQLKEGAVVEGEGLESSKQVSKSELCEHRY